MTRDFNVGDKVIIRQWDDMEREFGLTGNAINCDCLFVPSMKSICGKVFTITQIEHDRVVRGLEVGHVISVDMIEHVDEETEIEFDNTAMDKFFDEFHVS